MKVQVYVYSPDIPSRFIGLNIIIYPNGVGCWVLKCTLSQSHLPGENAADFLQLQPITQYQFSFQLVRIASGWTDAVWI